jgi:hypothetical protein
MSSLLTALIDIVRLAAFCNEDQGALKVAPAQAILADICAPHLPAAQIDQLADALVACVEGRSDALPSLDAIEPALADAKIEDRLSRASLALNELLTLHYALRTGADKLARLEISGTYLFDYLQECYIDAAPGQPSIVLIGVWLPPLGEVKVRLNTNDRLLRQIDISYGADSLYPYLNLKLWSNSKTMQARAGRQDYQKDGPSYDLNLWSRYDDKCKGEIRTRLAMQPYTIDSSRMSMSFRSIVGVELHETCIVDGQGNSLVTCLRAARHTSP